jgi:hypothetical protein
VCEVFDERRRPKHAGERTSDVIGPVPLVELFDVRRLAEVEQTFDLSVDDPQVSPFVADQIGRVEEAALRLAALRSNYRLKDVPEHGNATDIRRDVPRRTSDWARPSGG